jgi:RimJ/RimL family protein N-acetyltransferase
MKKNKEDIFLSGKKVDLIVLKLKHAKNTDWYKWFNDQALTLYTKQGHFPNTKEKQIKYLLDFVVKKKDLEKKINENQKLQLGIVKKNKNKLLGVISLYRFDYSARCCEISIFINYKKLKESLSVYKEAQNLLINHAFNKMNFRRIQTTTFSKELAILANKLFNFKIEGIQKEREYVKGKYHDSYLLGLLKKNWVY